MRADKLLLVLIHFDEVKVKIFDAVILEEVLLDQVLESRLSSQSLA